MAGMAIEASMLGAAHALANPITATFKIPHGQAVGLLMPHVIRFNGQLASIDADYSRLLALVEDSEEDSNKSQSNQLADWFSRLLTLAGMKTQLCELDVAKSSLDSLAVEAAKQWTASFNPVPVSATELLQIYDQAF